ncbi:MAG: crossover junction endodeoxyribonuclease RuvC [Actinomycetota bacterium]|nr:MAG: crossover junction endodeoxyribonuclease RuvC [Actinomycetota bacterium]
MRVLGVDPGLTRCGVGVVEGSAGRHVQLVYVDVLRTAPSDDVASRLCGIVLGIERVLDEYRPDLVAVERVFSQHNVRTVMGTAQAGGVVIAAAARRGLPVVLHTPSEVKAAVTGYGRADKAQVTAMVRRLLRLPVDPTPADAADALALAICQLWRGGVGDRLRSAAAAAPASRIPRRAPVATAPRIPRRTAAAPAPPGSRRTAAVREQPATAPRSGS